LPQRTDSEEWWNPNPHPQRVAQAAIDAFNVFLENCSDDVNQRVRLAGVWDGPKAATFHLDAEMGTFSLSHEGLKFVAMTAKPLMAIKD
jgi:hypothetical protein